LNSDQESVRIAVGTASVPTVLVPTVLPIGKSWSYVSFTLGTRVQDFSNHFETAGLDACQDFLAPSPLSMWAHQLGVPGFFLAGKWTHLNWKPSVEILGHSVEDCLNKFEPSESFPEPRKVHCFRTGCRQHGCLFFFGTDFFFLIISFAKSKTCESLYSVSTGAPLCPTTREGKVSFYAPQLSGIYPGRLEKLPKNPTHD